jgi:F-type H+-transporting ATPase subunit gamma
MVKVLVGQTEEQQSVYLKQPEFVKNILVIVIAPKKGLCGSLIGNLQRAVANFVLKNKVHEDANFSFVTIGKKSFDIVKVFNKSVLADFTVSERDLDANSIEPTIDFVVEKLTDKTIDTVFVAYTEFINTMTQKPVIKQFLPIPPQEVEAENDKKEQDSQFIFEPNSSEVLDTVIRSLNLYTNILESIASDILLEW